ncbi:Protein transport protein sec20 [Cymbomonas tetramitiformis]|uniref:Protein transport protein sec20 n=1 Tax=Cymbomonas tetramitiformis TaxID=36881 RepID=A0AAE0CDW3_9CHLO|nr:Protein transport protein sec20 [Cymbomonas tetramitiformis]
MFSEDASELLEKLGELRDSARAEVGALGSCGSGGENDPRVCRINAKVQEGLTEMRKLLEELEVVSDEQISDEDRSAIVVEIQRFNNEYKGIRQELRQANLVVRKNVVQAEEEERALLMKGSESAVRQRRKQTEEENAAAAEEVTEGLRRTRQMMVQELERTGKSAAALRESTSTLKKTEQEFASQQPLLAVSKKLLHYLQKQGVVDRIIFVGCFVLFLLVVLHIVLKRVPVLNFLHPYSLWSAWRASSSEAASLE